VLHLSLLTQTKLVLHYLPALLLTLRLPSKFRSVRSSIAERHHLVRIGLNVCLGFEPDPKPIICLWRLQKEIAYEVSTVQSIPDSEQSLQPAPSFQDGSLFGIFETHYGSECKSIHHGHNAFVLLPLPNGAKPDDPRYLKK